MRLADSGLVMTMSSNKSSGFTLIEVMIALAIFAVAVASLSTAMQGNIRNADYLKEKTIANWIANNRLVEIQAEGTYPPLQDKKDKIEYAGSEWVVNTKVLKAQTKLPIRIIDVSVGRESDGEPNYFTTITALASDTK